MGIFGGTEYSVASATFRLIETPADPVKEAVLNAIANGGSITDYIISDALLGGMGNQIDSFYRYGKDSYFLGLPGGSTGNFINVSDAELEVIIKSSTGLTQDLQIDSSTITSLSEDIVLMTLLTKNRGYIGRTSQITILPDDLIITEGGEVYVTNVTFDSVAGTLVDVTYTAYELERTMIVYNEGTDVETYGYEDTLVESFTYVERFYLPIDIQIGALYCVAKFSILDTGGAVVDDTLWWLYQISTNIYPEFIATDTTEIDSFLPVVPLRYDNADLTSSAYVDTELYKTSKTLLNNINIKIDDLASSLNENPDIASIDHAYVMFGINVQDTEYEGIEYLVNFFDHLYDLSYTTQSDYNAALLNQVAPDPNQYTFNDVPIASDGVINLDEYGLYITVTYDYITSDTVAGSIGAVGTATRTMSSEEYQVWVEDEWTVFEWGTDGNAGLETRTRGVLELKLQVTSTRYKVIKVVNLEHYNLIYSKKGKTVRTDILQLMADADNNNLIIPVHYGVAQTIASTNRSTMYEQSFIMIVNSVEKTHVNWYSSSFFSGVLMVIGAILYFSPFTAWLGNWFISMGLTALSYVVSIVSALVIGMALTIFLSMVADSLSADLFMVISVLVTVYKIFTGSFLSSVSAVVDTRNKYELIGLEEDMEDMSSEYELAWEELDDLNDLLEIKADYDPLLWAKSVITNKVENEHPDSFFTRTGNNGNTSILQYIENYHDILLTLPETDSDYLTA